MKKLTIPEIPLYYGRAPVALSYEGDELPKHSFSS